MTTISQGLLDAQAAFAGEGLPWPPVPTALAQRLAPRAEAIYATRSLPRGPYGIARYVDEAIAQPAIPDYAVVGFDGHGTNSWAAHVFLLLPGLALFVQVPWGGVYTDAQASTRRMQELFEWAGRLIPQVQACAQAGRIAAGERLVVVASQIVPSRWAWVQAPALAQPVAWNIGAGMLASVEASLAQRLTGS